MNSWFRLVALALGIAAAGPALAFNITVSSRAASFGGAGTVVSVAPVGAGDTWQNTTPAINCATGSSANCVGDAVVVGTAVWLRANPAAGSAFANWVGCAATAATLTIDGTATPGNFCRVNTSAAKNVTAYFKPAQFTLTVRPGVGSVDVGALGTCAAPAASCPFTVPAGGAVELIATGTSTADFDRWSGCDIAGDNTANPCTVTVTGNKTVAAYYAANAFNVGVSVSGPGAVAGGGIDCPGVLCSTTVNKGEGLTLTATPNGGASVAAWFGCPSVSADKLTCTFTNVQSNKSVSVVFKDGGCVSCHQNPPSSHGPNVATLACDSCHGASFSTTSVGTGHNDGNGTLVAGARPTVFAKPAAEFTYTIDPATIVITGGTTVTSFEFEVKDAAGNAVAAIGGTGQPPYPSVGLAMLQDDGSYKSYYNRWPCGASYYKDGVLTTPVLASGFQGRDAGAGASNANFSAVSSGRWKYTFPTVAQPGACGSSTTFGNPTVFTDGADNLHTIAVWAGRTVDGYVFRAYDSADFAPNGTTVTEREVVSDDACNKCHGSIAIHGSPGRPGVKTCLICHNTSTIDPESGNNVDLAEMIHKIHNGHLLHNDYFIVGHGTAPNLAVLDPEHILMAPSHSGYFEGGGTRAGQHDPGLSRECGICHDEATAAQAANAYTKGSRRACTSCHDDQAKLEAIHPAHNTELVTLPTEIGEPPVPTTPRGGPTQSCTGCAHGSSSVRRVHSRYFAPAIYTEPVGGYVDANLDPATRIAPTVTSVNFMDAAAVTPAVPATGNVFEAKLVSVANGGSGIVWTVDFKLDGAAFDIKNMAASFRWATCNFMFAGPTSDYTTPATGGTVIPNPGCALTGWTATATPGRFTYTAANWFNNKAAGYYTASFEIMIQRVFGDATDYVRKPFSANPNFLTVRSTGTASATISVVTDPVEQALRSRRAVVTFDKCNACHVDLGFHSNRGRKGPDYCATCHNPKLDNGGRARYLVADARAANTFNAAFGTELVYLPESVSMNVFIHRIHMGSRLPSVALSDIGDGGSGQTASKYVQKQGEIAYGATRSAFVGVTDATAPEIADFSQFAMPNTMNRCDQCHIAEGSMVTWGLPETTGLAPIERTLKVCVANTVDLPWWDSGNSDDDWCANASTSGPAAYDPDGAGALTGKIVTPPMKGVCTSCHDSAATDAHADAFTSAPMTAGAVEFCATCHGAGKVLDSLNVHRIQPVP